MQTTAAASSSDTPIKIMSISETSFSIKYHWCKYRNKVLYSVLKTIQEYGQGKKTSGWNNYFPNCLLETNAYNLKKLHKWGKRVRINHLRSAI